MPINPLSTDDTIDPNNPDKANTTNSGGVSTAQSPSTQISSGTSSTVSGAPSGQGAATGAAPAATPGSGNFTNLNQYVEANKDQGAGLGNAVAQGVQKSANTGLTSLSGAQNEFNTAEKAAGVNPNDYTTEKVYGVVQNALTNPSSVQQSDIANANDVKTKATNLAAGSDTAPKALTDLSSYQTAAGQLTDAQNNATLTGTEAGRGQLLKQQFARPDYSAGQNNLDQLLTQNIPANQQKFDTLRQSLLGQYGLASQENQAIQNAADTRAKTVSDTTNAEQNIQNVLFGSPTADANGNPITPAAAPQGVQYGVLGNYYNQLQAAPTTANQQQATDLAAKQTALTNYLTSQYGQSVYGVPVSQLVNSMISTQNPTGSASLTNTMTPQQLQSLQVLNQLAGQTGSNINTIGTGPNATVIDPNAVGQNQFNAGVNENVGAGQDIVNQKAGQYRSDIGTATKSALNDFSFPAEQTGLGTLQGQQGIQTALNYLQPNMASATTLYNAGTTLQRNLDKINQVRSSYNLPAVTLSPVEQSEALNQAWLQAGANGARTSNPITNEAGRPGNPVLANQLILNWQQRSKNPNDQDAQNMLSAVKNAANVIGLNTKLQQLQANPFMGTSSPDLSKAPGAPETTAAAPAPSGNIRGLQVRPG